MPLAAQYLFRENVLERKFSALPAELRRPEDGDGTRTRDLSIRSRSNSLIATLKLIWEKHAKSIFHQRSNPLLATQTPLPSLSYPPFYIHSTISIYHLSRGIFILFSEGVEGAGARRWLGRVSATGHPRGTAAEGDESVYTAVSASQKSILWTEVAASF